MYTHWHGYIRQINRLNLSMLCNRPGHKDKIRYSDLRNRSVGANIDRLTNISAQSYGDKHLNRKYKRSRLDQQNTMVRQMRRGKCNLQNMISKKIWSTDAIGQSLSYIHNPVVNNWKRTLLMLSYRTNLFQAPVPHKWICPRLSSMENYIGWMFVFHIQFPKPLV